ncbi:MAG TPA: hypothetical protein VH595_04865 [Verrucomicrobiae bacterium]|nr:hypothetical protein [Verrucomicrobiae bacterium]
MKNKSSLFACHRTAGLATVTGLSMCLLTAPNAWSQAYTFTPGPPADVTKAVGNEMNPSVAINPLNGNNVFTVSASDLGALVTAVSSNQGGTWAVTNIANGGDNLSQAFQYPSAAYDSYGNLYVAYLPATFEGVSIAISTNNGQNFTMLTNLAAGDATETPRICAGPASAPGSVWVVYKDNSQSGTPLIAQGLQATSLGTNSQFGPPFSIPGSASGGFPDIAIGPAGQVLVAYQNNINVSGSSKIFTSINTNAFGTNGFGPAITVTANAVGGLTYIPAQPTGVGINASVSLAWDVDPYSSFYGRAYVIYSAVATVGKSQTEDIGFRYSLNNGSTWSAQETVNDDTTNANSSFMPRVAVDPVTGIVACSWYDCRNDQGANSHQITETENATFTFSTFFATNVIMPPGTPTLSATLTTNNTAGTSYTLAITGTDLMGSLLSTNGTTPDTVTLSTVASNYFFAVQFQGNTGTNATGTNTTVTVTVSDTFSDAFTTGNQANTEPMTYTTISTTGGASFQANKSVIVTNKFASATANGVTSLISPIPPDSLVSPPVEGFGSDVATSQSAFGLGSYTGLAFYAGSFYPAWADNSDITLANPAGPLNNFDVSIVEESVPTSDLTLFITNSPNPVLSDGVIAYSIIAINNGPFASTGVTNVDTLPANVVFETAVPSVGGSYSLSGNQVTLTFPSIPAHGSLTNLILVRAGYSAYGTNISIITGPLPDTLPTNNTNILVTLFEGEDLAIGMTASSLNLYGGQTVTNTISVTNFGPSANGNVIVSNGFSSSWGQLAVLSSGWTEAAEAVVPGEYSINSNVIDLNVGLLSSNQTTNIIVSALALATAPTGISTVSVSSLDYDTNMANNATTIISAMTAQTVSAGISAGQPQVGVPLTFTIVVTNLGPSSYGYLAATNILPSSFSSVQVLQSPLPATVTNSMIIFPIGPLPSNGTATLVFTAIPQTVAPVMDTFTVSSFDYAPAFKTGVTITSAPPSTPIENFQVIPGSSGAFLVWNTPAAATVQVDYGTNTAYGKVTSVSGPSTHHIVLLSGLTPGANYYFNALTTEAGILYPTNGSFSTGPSTLILQTQDATYGGLWTANTTGTGIYGSYFSTSDTVAGSPTATATYAPNIPVSGNYDVSIWYPISTTFATNTPVYISGATNELFVTVNQNIKGGSWLPLATNVYFAAGTGGNVVIANNTGYTNKGVAANAVEWTYGAAQDTTSGSIPSWWANFYFGTNTTVSGSADADGDGYSNYAEYVFGTDPTDPTSKLNFTVTPLGGNMVSVNFTPYQGGRNYQLLSATTLASPQWMVLTNVATVDTNGNGVFTLTQPNGANAFYRLSSSISQ